MPDPCPAADQVEALGWIRAPAELLTELADQVEALDIKTSHAGPIS
jgi:hypothetical protein